MSALLPRIRRGGWSSETIDGDGLEGWFVSLDWFGARLEISFATVARHEREMAKWRAEREAQK